MASSTPALPVLAAESKLIGMLDRDWFRECPRDDTEDEREDEVGSSGSVVAVGLAAAAAAAAAGPKMDVGGRTGDREAGVEREDAVDAAGPTWDLEPSEAKDPVRAE